ncbi:MAG: competence protein CoiA [Syntrophales bacterium]
MPFIALDKATHDRVDITRLAEPRETLKGKEFQCQLCGIKMIMRGGYSVRFHFYHYRACTTSYASNPETPEHINGKYYVAEQVLTTMKDFADFTPQYEIPIPEVMRVADIITEFPMGWRIAHEIQLSPITVDELDRRTSDYLRAGIDVLWWFGKSADTPANRDWAIKRNGFSLSLKYDKSNQVRSGLWRETLIEDRFNGKYFGQVYENNESKRPNTLPPVAGAIAGWWNDYALARYYQVWKKGNSDRYKRGLLASTRSIASFNGKTGVGKDKFFHKEGALWLVDLKPFLDRQEKYSHIRPLSDAAIALIQGRAHSYGAKQAKERPQ